MDYLRKLVHEQGDFWATKGEFKTKPMNKSRVIQFTPQRHSQTLSFRIIPIPEAPITMTSIGEKGPIETFKGLPNRQPNR